MFGQTLHVLDSYSSEGQKSRSLQVLKPRCQQGCFLLEKVKVKFAQLCPALCDAMDYTVHRILQARILEVGSLSLLQGIFPTQGLNPGLLHCRQILYQLSSWRPQGKTRSLPLPHLEAVGIPQLLAASLQYLLPRSQSLVLLCCQISLSQRCL